MLSRSRRLPLWLLIAQTLPAFGLQGLHDHAGTRSVGPGCDDSRLHIERRDGLERSTHADDCVVCRVRLNSLAAEGTPEPIAFVPPSERIVIHSSLAFPSTIHARLAIRAPPFA